MASRRPGDSLGGGNDLTGRSENRSPGREALRTGTKGSEPTESSSHPPRESPRRSPRKKARYNAVSELEGDGWSAQVAAERSLTATHHPGTKELQSEDSVVGSNNKVHDSERTLQGVLPEALRSLRGGGVLRWRGGPTRQGRFSVRPPLPALSRRGLQSPDSGLFHFGLPTPSSDKARIADEGYDGYYADTFFVRKPSAPARTFLPSDMLPLRCSGRRKPIDGPLT